MTQRQLRCLPLSRPVQDVGVMKPLSVLCSAAVLITACKKSDNGISISCGSVGKDFEVCKEGVEAWSRKTGHKATVVTSTTSSTDKLAAAQQLLGAESSDVDVYSVDVVWPGILGKFFIDLKPYTRGAEAEHFPALVANGTLDGKLVAMPWFADAGLLYYRKDLLDKYNEPVPTTWAQLTATARKIQDAERAAGNKDMQGFVFQGKAYEGLTCNALEWVVSYGGGSIVEPDGKISINNPSAAAALELASSWPGTISPTGALNAEEDDARGVFQSGNAVFMRNWPYAWATSQEPTSPVKDKVGVAPLPRDEGERARPAATLGGWDLAVSKFSRHPAEAADLVMYLTSPAEQKRRAITAGFNPTIPSLYSDKDVAAANPFLASMGEVFKGAAPRPSTVTAGRYNQVSNAFFNAVHAVLAREKPARDALAELAGTPEQLKGTKW